MMKSRRHRAIDKANKHISMANFSYNKKGRKDINKILKMLERSHYKRMKNEWKRRFGLSINK